MQENGVEETNSCYRQRQKLPTGQMTPVEVQPPNKSLTVEQLGNAETYSMMLRRVPPNSVECMKSTLKLSIYLL